MLSKIVRPEIDFREKRRLARPTMFQAGDLSDASGDEDDVLPARIGQAPGRTYDSDGEENGDANFFRRAAPIYPKLILNHENGGAGLRRTTSSIARISMAIRRSLRLPRRSEARLTREQEEVQLNKERKPEGRLFTENTRNTRVGPSSEPSRLDEILENKRLNRVDKVKKIIRKSDWPVFHEIRSKLWKELCNNKCFDSSRILYISALEDYDRVNRGKPQTPQILTDDGAVINNYDLKEKGTLKLVRILLIIEQLRPEIVYAPLIYPICSLFLHYYDDDADIFACVNYLLNNKGYMMTAPVQWAASSHTILALIKKHKSAAYALLKKRLGSADDAVLVKCLQDWLQWLFQYLPMQYTCRIVDCYIAEGHKFLIRSAISIVYIWSKIQKSSRGNMEDFAGKSLDEKIDAIRTELKNTASGITISTSTFIATAVKIRNLQSSTIARLQAQYEEELRDEVTSRPRRIRKVRRTIFCEAFKSSLIDNDSAVELMSFMPARLQLITPRLVYKLSQDGASFFNFWDQAERADQSILIIKTTDNEIFGAYLSSSWAERHDRKERTKSKYWGTGESFVFKMNEELELPEIYEWVGNAPDASSDNSPQYFMAATDNCFVIGSGGGDAIRISEEITTGISMASETFGSPQLCKHQAFEVYDMEVWKVLTEEPTEYDLARELEEKKARLQRNQERYE